MWKRIREVRGYTVVDMINAMLLIAVIMGLSAFLGRRAVARYQLQSAARELVTDLARVKTQAIQTNSITTVRRDSESRYRASETPRQLPAMVRFGEASADSVAFNGLGGVADGGSVRFVLVNSYGEAREVVVYGAGGQEVLEL